MKLNFHLKIAIGIIVVFGLLLLGFALWTPVRVKYYSWQYNSPDVATRVKAVDGLIRLGEPGIAKLKAIYPDGPEAAEMLIECWDDVGKLIKDPNKALALLKLGKGWEFDPSSYYIPPSYLHVAAFNGYLETVALLISKGADVDKKNDNGMTPLHMAAWHGQTATAEFLISKGADVNTVDMLGMTPLHDAAQEGHTKITELLISKGATINAKDNDDLTALDRAIKEMHEETEKLLLKHGVKTGAELEAEKK